ncbi:hypothetical protein CEP53_010213 [Fusarium sp. AF-6]|nr:hypothetical protein CEP53_010213 [Fusarium sp. AF-6]
MDAVFGPFEQPYGVNRTTDTEKESKKPQDPSRAIAIVLLVILGLFLAALLVAIYFTCKKRAKQRKVNKTDAATAPEIA